MVEIAKYFSQRQPPAAALENYAGKRKSITDYVRNRLFPILEKAKSNLRKVREVLPYAAGRRTDLKKYIYA